MQEEPYVDAAFPPETKSLFNPTHSKLSKIEFKKWKKLEWIRPAKAFQEPELISSTAPIDIQQGIMKNTYMQCALIQLSLYPTLIQAIFTSTKKSSYNLQLFNNGLPTTISIDDSLPYDLDSNTLAFTKCNQKHLWALLIEKAWAKLNGSYEAIHTAQSYEVIRAFTGLPYEHLIHETLESELSLWAKMTDAIQKNYLIISSLEKPNEHTIDCLSCYVIKLINCKDEKNEEHKLVMLNNPMKIIKWEGKWSAKSSTWTAEAKTSANYKEDLNTIYMELDDYYGYFKNTTIFRVISGAKHKCINSFLPEKQRLMVEVKCNKPLNGCIIVSQSEKRLMCSKYQNYESSNVSILVGKGEKNTEYIGGVTTQAENIIVPIEGDQGIQGEYVMNIEADWEFAEINEIVVTTYFNGEVEIKILDINKFPEILDNILTSCATKISKRKTYEDKDEPKIWRCVSINDTKANYGFVYYCNQSKASVLVENYKFTATDGIEILNNKGDKLEFNVNPESSLLIKLKKLKPTSSFTASYQSFIQKCKGDLLTYIENDAKVKQTEFKIFDEPTKVFLRIYSHDFGYVMKIVNQNPSKVFDGIFTFTLDNLSIESGTKWPIKLQPYKSEIKFLTLLDVNKPASYKYSCTMQLTDFAVSEAEILSKLKAEDIKQLSINDKPLQAYYNILLIGDFYYWYFENRAEHDLAFILKFEVDNLEKLSDCEFSLKPSEYKILKQGIIDQSKPSSYKVKITFLVDSKESTKSIYSKDVTKSICSTKEQ